MNKKVFAVLLAMMTAAGAMASCNNNGGSSGSSGSAGGSSGDSGSGPVALSAVTIRSTTDGEFPYPILQKLQQEANVDITWQIEQSADWPTKKSVLLASGKLPDLFFGADLLDGEVNTGSFIDWAPYIDQTTNIKQFLEEYPDAKSMATTADGKIFGIPNMIAFRPESGDVLYVNKTWCDQLEIALPKTTDDFFNMLIAFRDKDPNGNGEQDEIGITGVGGTVTADSLTDAGALAWVFPAFGVVMNHDDTYCMVKDGTPEFQPITDNYRAAVEYIAKMWAENLIDREYFSLDFATQAAKFRGETLLLGSGSGWTMSNNTGDNLKHYEIIPPLTGPNGDQYWNASTYEYKMYVNRTAIAATCANVEAAVHFFDLCYDEWNGFQLTYGSEGIATEKGADGNPAFIATPEGYTDPEWKFVNGLDTNAPTWASADFVASITGENDAMEKYRNDVYYSEYFLNESKMPYIVYDADTLQELSILKTDINSYIKQSFADFVVNGVTDDSWNAYLDQLNRMSVDKLIQIYTDGYNKTAK
ncbi:MAG: extracellular solute-binding protein [Oscillospiraceae bacterium]|nr:extracellular solute-binding protein [Oscillospiraceae bacterium]